MTHNRNLKDIQSGVDSFFIFGVFLSNCYLCNLFYKGENKKDIHQVHLMRLYLFIFMLNEKETLEI